MFGCVDFALVVVTDVRPPDSSSAGGNLTELVEQLDNMVEHPNYRQPNLVSDQLCHPVDR